MLEVHQIPLLNEIGDVLITWENEALLAINKIENHNVEIIIPSTSILAEPTVSIVDKVVDKKELALWLKHILSIFILL